MNFIVGDKVRLKASVRDYATPSDKGNTHQEAMVVGVSKLGISLNSYLAGKLFWSPTVLELVE